MDFIHTYLPPTNPEIDTTLVLLHGTGGNESDLIPLGQLIAPGAGLLGIRGKVLEGSAPRFFKRLSEGVFDEEDLRFRTHELSAFLEWATTQYQLKPNCLVAIGYSNGANIAASLLLLEPQILAAAVLFRAMVPLKPETLPDLAGRSVLIQSGRMDPIVPATSSEQLATMLRQAGADVTLKWQEVGHNLTQAEIGTTKSWLQTFNQDK